VIENGDRVKDRVTGFEGVVTGVGEYITGCRQCLVQPSARDGKYEDGRWLDDDRLELLQEAFVTMPNRTRDGGPQSNAAPVR
jgi:hypothetical protein